MKTTNKLIIFAIASLFMAASAHALTPREELNQMVQQLQKNPSDNALREKIIKLAQRIKPAPAIPEDALRREGRAKFAFKNAKSNDDYLGAAREYEEAVRVAPWVSGYYSDLCTIYEKAEKYVEAKRNCEFYLTGLSDPSQVNEVKQRIAGLEYGLENAPKTKAARQRKKDEELVKSLDGATFVDLGGGFDDLFRVEGQRIVLSQRRNSQGVCLCNGACSGPLGAETLCTIVMLTGRQGEITAHLRGDAPRGLIEIAEDGSNLTTTFTVDGKTYTRIYPRGR